MTIENKYKGFIFTGLAIVLLFSFMASLYPEMAEGGNSLNDTNLCFDAGGSTYNSTGCFDVSNNTVDFSSFPLSSLIAGGGIIFLIVSAGLIYVVIKKVGQK